VSPELTSRLQKTSDELKQLSQDIKTGTVDVRVLVEFRKAMNNARHTAYAVQKWIQEEQKAGGNPFPGHRHAGGRANAYRNGAGEGPDERHA